MEYEYSALNFLQNLNLTLHVLHINMTITWLFWSSYDNYLQNKWITSDRGPDQETPMMLGPKNEKQEQKAFGEEEELQPYCKFCFAKIFKISILNIQETVNTMPENCGMSL